ncbi:ABC transporter substrate-binding protein [Nocardiopsis coralliicola]
MRWSPALLGWAGALGAGSLVLSGCSAGSGAGSDDTGTLAVGFTAEPASFDFTRDDGVAIPEVLLSNVYEGLVKLSPEGEIEPLLAEDWEISEDRTEYTFTLREGATFSNGAPFTADDVAFSIERAQEEWTVAVADAMDAVEEVEPVSDTEVRIRLEEPSNSWLYAMTTRVGAMFSPTGVDDLAAEPVGTGPYTVVDRTRGDSIELAVRDDYWGDAPAVDAVEFRYFDDPTALGNALSTGELDVVSAIGSADDLERFTSEDRFRLIEGTTNGEVVLGLNQRREAFTDDRVRQAIAHAVDRDAILDTVWNGHGTAIGSMVPPTDPWFTDLTGTYPHDPERAEELLDEAGATDLSLDFRVPNLPYAMSTAQVVQSQLEEVGITTEIEPLEFPAVWLEDVFSGHDYDLTLIQHTEGRDLPMFGDPDYYWGYDSDALREELDAADRGTEAEQTEHMEEASRILAEDVAAVFLYLQPSLIVADARVQGLPENRVTESFDVTALSWG